MITILMHSSSESNEDKPYLHFFRSHLIHLPGLFFNYEHECYTTVSLMSAV
jgi:hypothetical protein